MFCPDPIQDQLTGTTGPGGAVAYTYDLDGRQTSAGSRTFSWAQPDRLASTRLGNTTTTYTYDGDGLRTLASTGNQANKKTQYDWDPNAGLAQLVAERNGSGNLIRRYRQGLDTVMLDTGGSPSYLHYDGLGSVVNLTSSTGVTQWTYAYLPYGAVRTETKNHNQAPAKMLRFSGEVLDPTGLYQLRARSYDPLTGRFLSIDPAAAGPTDPYVSAYAYVNGNPVRLVDPSGRCGQSFVLAVFGPVGAGAAFGISAACIFVVAASALGPLQVVGSEIGNALGDQPAQSNPLIDEAHGSPTWVPGIDPQTWERHLEIIDDFSGGLDGSRQGGGGGFCARHTTTCLGIFLAPGGAIIWAALQGQGDITEPETSVPPPPTASGK